MKPNEDVNVVRHHLQRKQHETAVLRDLPKNPLTLTLNLAGQNFVTILRVKYYMKTHLPESIAHAKHIHIGTSKAASKGAGEARAPLW